MYAAHWVLLVAIIYLSASETYCYSIGNLCSSDSDCPAADATYCNRLTTVTPACQKGTCICRPGYTYDGSTACLQYNNLTLGQACSGAINERPTWGATCQSSVVTCQAPTYVGLTPTRCAQLIVQPVYGLSCNSSNTTTSCNSTLNFDCSSTTKLCICKQTNMIYQSSLSACRLRTYGDACGAIEDCDSGVYTNKLVDGGGANCVSSSCGCASGFTMVQRLSYENGVQTTLNLCLKGYNNTLTQNATCTVLPEQISSSGALVCNTSYACIRCPEDSNSLSTQGICRAVLTSSCSAIQSSAIGAMSPDQVVAAIKGCGGLSGQDTIQFDLALIALSLLLILALVHTGKS